MKKSLMFLIMAMITLTPLMASSRTDRYDKTIRTAVEKYQPGQAENFSWHKGRIMQESAFKEDAISPVGAKGICQFIDATAKALGVDPWNPESSINGMVRYTNMIRDYYAKNDGYESTALYAFERAYTLDQQMIIDAGYNWRMDRITRLARVYGFKWEALQWRLPLETRNYAPSIQKYKQQFEADRKKTFLT